MSTFELPTGFTEVPSLSTAPVVHPKKRIIICCDGTWQASNHGLANVPSNIAKISRAIASYEKTESGEYIHQVVFYDAGVGTATDTVRGTGFVQDKIAIIVKKWEGGVGAGLDENVCEVYNFIVSALKIRDHISITSDTVLRSTITIQETNSTFLAFLAELILRVRQQVS
jgi:uncharacterized protein (DUF2235 family)